MKAAKIYVDTIRKALKNWTEWTENGESILRKEQFNFHYLISREAAKLKGLDAQDVVDAILEHEDDIEFRLKRLDNYKFVDIVQYIIDTQRTKVQLSENWINGEIYAYRQLIETKALDLIKAIDECEKYIKPQHPVIAKTLAHPVLLSYVYDNKKVLKEYIVFCLKAKTIQQKAWKAMELKKDGKIKEQYIRKPLHDALEETGIDVGNWRTWDEHIRKFW